VHNVELVFKGFCIGWDLGKVAIHPSKQGIGQLNLPSSQPEGSVSIPKFQQA
jgi:hypothetical protein